MEYREDFESDEEFTRYLIETGSISLAGIAEDGEFVYSINEEACKKYCPQLWEAHVKEIDDAILNLFEEGMVNIEYNENLEAEISLTEKGEELARLMEDD